MLGTQARHRPGSSRRIREIHQRRKTIAPHTTGPLAKTVTLGPEVDITEQGDLGWAISVELVPTGEA
jgi:hypothetical protein